MLALAGFGVIVACSTSKDKFVNREFQALNTKYNVLFHGNNALNDGIHDLAVNQKDNFWEVLPVEKMQPVDKALLPGETKNANFQRAEDKATKAIQKRSMNISGRERNSQMDEAYLLLGKSRYYDGRFLPALEAFNYVLYKNPDSDKIYEARIWKEKTNMRLENDAVAAKNLKNLLHEIKIKGQTFADANATLSQAYYNLGENNLSIHCLKKAIDFTKHDEEKARYRFILGQMYEKLDKKDSAYAAFQSVIDMHRRSPRVYVVQAQGHLAKQFDYKKGDTLAFVKKYQRLLKDHENRPYQDVIYHQMGLYYDQKNSDNQAKKYYKKSLKTKSADQYLVASNYRYLGQIHFDQARYVLAGKYYDSTLVNLQPRTREYNQVKRKRENLEDVIKYEGIAQTNDSILNLLAMSQADQKKYFETYIGTLKKQDAEKVAKQKQAEAKTAQAGVAGGNDIPAGFAAPPGFNAQPPGALGATGFYFYSPSAVTSGKQDFKKKWGDRKLGENWRLSLLVSTAPTEKTEGDTDETITANEKSKDKKEKPEYTTDFYAKKLPTDQSEIATLVKDRNFAYYQLGIIYKEKFNELNLAADKLERLLKNDPEERLVLPSMYHLYKIYELIDKQKSLAMKDKIISQYPDSRYASILKNPGAAGGLSGGVPEKVYSNLYEMYEGGDYIKALEETEAAITQFTGEDIVPKLELLHANIIGKLKGIEEYKNALNFVALNYPNSKEGKDVEATLKKNVPAFESMQFSKNPSKSWKILYELTKSDDANTKALEAKIKRFVQSRSAEGIKYSLDIYTMDESLLVIHGIATEIDAKDIVTILTDYKDYKVSEPAIIISTDNYKVVQVRKNLKEYLEFAKPAPEPVAPVNSVPSGQNASVQDKLPEKVIPGAMVAPAPKAPVKPTPQTNQPQDKKTENVIPGTMGLPAQKNPGQPPVQNVPAQQGNKISVPTDKKTQPAPTQPTTTPVPPTSKP